MKKLLMTSLLVALTALSACKKAEDANNVAPAAGDETSMSAPADTTTTTTTTTDTTAAPAADATATPAPATAEPEAASDAAAAPAATTAPAADASATTSTCGDHSDLVGKAVADVDTKALGDNVRVIKPGDAVTQDFNGARINIDVDADGKVTGVHCG